MSFVAGEPACRSFAQAVTKTMGWLIGTKVEPSGRFGAVWHGH
jgi:hypothetical protein